jgi:hypothetical protein
MTRLPPEISRFHRKSRYDDLRTPCHLAAVAFTNTRRSPGVCKTLPVLTGHNPLCLGPCGIDRRRCAATCAVSLLSSVRRKGQSRAQALIETGEGSGLPAKCAFRLSRINAVAAVRDSGARPATCGVTTTLSHCRSSGSIGGTLGSPSRTSRPAPATRFDRSASISAWVSTTVPRPTLST